MRNIQNPQPELGSLNIANIEIDIKSRDDIPAILLGLQFIYTTPEIRDRVFEVLSQVQADSKIDPSKKARTDTGRPGMDQWNILVLGVLRLGLNTDYDRIHDLANHHLLIRQMLGHASESLAEQGDPTKYSLQAIKDNLRLFTPEIFDQINQIVVEAGHALVKKSQKMGKQKMTNQSIMRNSMKSNLQDAVIHLYPQGA